MWAFRAKGNTHVQRAQVLFVRGGSSLTWEGAGFLGTELEQESSQCPELRGQVKREGLQNQEAS